MAGELSDGQELARTALVTAITAAAVIPDFIPALEWYYKFQCDPGSMYAAGTQWIAIGEQLLKARSSADDSVQSLDGESWAGNDHDAFTTKFGQFGTELVFDATFAYTVGIALCVVAVLLYVRIVLMLAMAVVLAVIAAAIVVAATTVFGAPVAAELEVTGDEVAAEMLEALVDMNEAYSVVENGMAGAITTMLATDTSVAIAEGDTAIYGELGQAAVHGLGTEASGLLSKALRDWTAKTFRADPVTGVASPTLPRSVFAALNGVDGVDPVSWMSRLLS